MYRHMAELGVSKSTAAPPAWRVLWRMGIEAPPPLFMSFLPVALGLGTLFAVFWGLPMWAFFWAFMDLPTSAVIIGSLTAGLFFGVSMAAYFRYLANKHGLPLWVHYAGGPEGSVGEAGAGRTPERR